MVAGYLDGFGFKDPFALDGLEDVGDGLVAVDGEGEVVVFFGFVDFDSEGGGG